MTNVVCKKPTSIDVDMAHEFMFLAPITLWAVLHEQLQRENWNFALMADGFRLNAIKIVGFVKMSL